MSSRDLVLARIRAALVGDGPAAPAAPIPRDYLRRGVHPPGSEGLIDLLCDRLIEYRAVVQRATAATLGQAVDEALAGMSTVVIDAGLDPVIARACAGNGRTVITDTVIASTVIASTVITDTVASNSAGQRSARALSPGQLDAIDAVVTTARVAVALTGTIVLDGGPGQGRRAISLVPDRHLIVLTADQVVETVAEAIGLLTPTAPLTMIAGPSATSDIELERVEGVHGPRTLHVVILCSPRPDISSDQDTLGSPEGQ